MKKIPLLLTPIFIFITTNIALAETIYSGKMLPMMGTEPTSANAELQLVAPFGVVNLENLDVLPGVRYIVSDEFKPSDFSISDITTKLVFSDQDNDLPLINGDALTPFSINPLADGAKIEWSGKIPNYLLVDGGPSYETIPNDSNFVYYGDIYDGTNSANMVTSKSWASRGVLNRGSVSAKITVPVTTTSQTGLPSNSTKYITKTISLRATRNGLDVNGVRFPFVAYNEGNSFPVTGSAGFFYDLVYELEPRQYDWRITPNDGHISIDTNRIATRVTLNSPPPPNTKYTITATPKQPGTTLPAHTHEFMLKKWFFDYGYLGNVYWQEALDFCQSLGPNYSLPSISDVFFIQNVAEIENGEGKVSPKIPPKGTPQHPDQKDTLGLSTRSNSFGKFANEWGNPTTGVDFTQIGFKNSFAKSVYWLRESIDDFRAASYNFSIGSNANSLNYAFKQGAKLPIMCMLDLSQPEREINPEPKPVISNLKIIGTIASGQTLKGQYDFDANLGSTPPTVANQLDRSRFAWGKQGTTASSVLTTSLENFVRESGKIPDSPVLTAEDVGTVYELSVQPRNGLDVTGDVVTVDTSMQN